MAKIERSIDIRASTPIVQSVIVDFQRYPDFVPHVERTEILETEGSRRRVRFTVNLVRRIGYTLDLTPIDGNGLDWVLVDGPFERNQGGWRLQRLGPDLTRATYSIDASLSSLLPSFIEERLVAKSLPEILAAFREEAERRATKES